MRRILITGCSGFLGIHLSKLLAERYEYQIFGLTEVSGFFSPYLKTSQVDIREREKVFDTIQALQPDIIYHLAAIANVGFSWKNQPLTYEINFIGSSNIIEALSQICPCSRLILMSSAELYGNCESRKCKETDTLASPKNPYSLSKYAMEMVGNLYQQTMDMDIITVRSFNFTGPGQSDQFVASDFSHQIAKIERDLQDPIIRVGNLSAIRDISDVRDIARYICEISHKKDPGGIYNLCSGSSYSIKEILEILLSFSKKKIKVEVDHDKLRPIDIPQLLGNTKRLKEEFNINPQYSIEQTLEDLLNDWREQLERKHQF